MSDSIEQLSLFAPRSEIPELEILGLRAETLMHRPRGQRTGGTVALYVFGRGLAEHGGVLEGIGFRLDSYAGGYWREKPFDERILMFALRVLPPELSADDAEAVAEPPEDIEAPGEKLAITDAGSPEGGSGAEAPSAITPVVGDDPGAQAAAAAPRPISAPTRTGAGAISRELHDRSRAGESHAIGERLLARRRREADAVATLMDSRPIGVNAKGHVVYERRGGERFYRDSDGADIFESDADVPGFFFRVRHSEDLAKVAMGILYQPFHGHAVSVPDVETILAAVQADSGPDGAITTDLLLDAIWGQSREALSRAETPQQARALAGRLHRLTGASFALIRGDRPSLAVMNFEREIAPTCVVDVPLGGGIDENAVLGAIPGENERVLLRVKGVDPASLDLRRLLGQIPAHCVVEGAVVIEPPLVDENVLMTVIGARRPEPVDVSAIPDEVFLVPLARDPEGLTPCLDAIRDARRNTAIWFDRIRRGEPTEDLTATAPAPIYQIPYQPVSRGESDGLFMPINLSEPMEEAKGNVRARRGDDLDIYVARRMRMTVQRLHAVLSAEQIDNVALASDAHERGRGMLIGNGTGTGKGRIAGAIAHIGVMDGNRMLVMTEGVQGIGTLLRDMRNLGVLEDKTMMLLNADTEVRDAQTGEVVFSKQKLRDIERRCMADGRPVWPDGVQIIFGTYSQFNKTSETSWRVRWLAEIMNDDVGVVCDEGHVMASAEANTASNFIIGLSRPEKVTYVTATWVGAADKAAVYYRLFGQDFPPSAAERIPAILARGGEPAQDALSGMFARDGVMVRLEPSMAAIQMQLSVSPNVEANRARYDMIAPIFAELMRYARAVRRNAEVSVEADLAMLALDTERQREILNDIAARNRRALVRTQPVEGNQDGADGAWKLIRANSTLRTMSFGSPLYRLSRALMAAVMVEDPGGVVAQAVDRLRNGMKPVIVFAETADALVADLVKQARQNGLDVPETPDFKHMLRATLRMAGRGRRGNGEVVNVEEMEELGAAAEERALAAELVSSLADGLSQDYEDGKFTREPHDPPVSEIMEETLMARIPNVVEAVTRQVNEVRQEAGERPLRAEMVRGYVMLAARNTFVTTRHHPPTLIERLREQAGGFSRETVDLTSHRDRISRMIDALPDLPMNFIDRVKRGIEREGYTVGEITGRQFTVSDDGVVTRRVREPTDIVARKFNSGEYNALIETGAGASMIDLHAAREFADQAQRTLMIVQTLSGTVMTQIAGRVNRRGQVINPRVEMLVTGLPVTYRFIAALNMQCERLGANVAAIRRHPLMCDAIAPLLSREGDVAAARFLLNNPDLRDLLEVDATEGFLVDMARMLSTASVDEDEDKGGVGDYRSRWTSPDRVLAAATRDNRRLANEILSRATCFSTDIQSQVIRLMEAEYYGRMEELAALGVDTSARHTIEGEVTRRIRIPLDMGDEHLPAARRSAFNAPLYIEGITVETQSQPLRSDDVKELVASAVARGDDNSLRRMEDGARASGARVRVAGGGDALDAIEQFNTDRSNRAADRIAELRIGCKIGAIVDGETVNAIVVGCHGPDWIGGRVDVVYPGGSKVHQITIPSIINMPLLYPVSKGLHGPSRDAALAEFDAAAAKRQIKPRWLLTGNMWKALHAARGRVVTMEDGSAGVLLPRQVRPPEFVEVPVTDAVGGMAELTREGENGRSARIVVELRASPAGLGAGVVVVISKETLLRRAENERYRMTISATPAAAPDEKILFTEEQLDELKASAGGHVAEGLGTQIIQKIEGAIAREKDLIAQIATLEEERAAGRQMSRREKNLIARRQELETMSRFGVPISPEVAVRVPDEQVSRFLHAVLASGYRVMVRKEVPAIRSGATSEWLLVGGRMPAVLQDAVQDIPGVRVLDPAPLERGQKTRIERKTAMSMAPAAE